ncbi:unnamed protein product [Urochloa humidicola]
MLAPASARVPHIIRPVASFFGLRQQYILNWDRYRRWPRTGNKTILSTRGVLESSNGAPSGGLVRKRKIVEHIILLRAKPNISDAEEKDAGLPIYITVPDERDTRSLIRLHRGPQ